MNKCELLALIVVVYLLGQCHAHEAELYKTLFKNYTKQVRPVKKAAYAVNITLDFELQAIKDLDDVNEVLYVVGFIRAGWQDDFLTWDPAAYGDIETLIVPPSVVWLPDLGIENSADTFYHESFTKDFRVKIDYEGNVTWSFGGGFATMCPLNMVYFPFDKQTCELRVENWAYNGDQVTLTNKTDKVNRAYYEEQDIWEFKDSEIEYDDIPSKVDPDITFPELKFKLRLRRKPKYYMMTIVAPCMMIIAVALSVFWMAPDTGEKVSLGVTVLLAFSVFQVIIADSTPKNSNSSPLLGDLVLSTMCLSTVSVLSSILVLYLHHHHTKTRPPLIVRKFVFRYAARFLCMRSWVPEVVNDGDAGEEAMMLEKSDQGKSCSGSAHGGNETEREILLHLKKITTKLREDSEDGKIVEEWKGVAIVLDRFLFCVSLFLITVLCLWILEESNDARFKD